MKHFILKMYEYIIGMIQTQWVLSEGEYEFLIS
jgi:hypothetical protein